MVLIRQEGGNLICWCHWCEVCHQEMSVLNWSFTVPLKASRRHCSSDTGGISHIYRLRSHKKKALFETETVTTSVVAVLAPLVTRDPSCDPGTNSNVLTAATLSCRSAATAAAADLECPSLGLQHSSCSGQIDRQITFRHTKLSDTCQGRAPFYLRR